MKGGAAGTAAAGGGGGGVGGYGSFGDGMMGPSLEVGMGLQLGDLWVLMVEWVRVLDRFTLIRLHRGLLLGCDC